MLNNKILPLVVMIIVSSLVPANAHDQITESSVKYSWELPEVSKKKLFAGIKLLRYGDDLSLVKNDIDLPPTKEDDLNDKQGNFQSHMVVFAVKRVTPEGGNVYDQEIILYFDQHKRLQQIDYNDMQPLEGAEIFSVYNDPQTDIKIYSTKPPKN